MCDGEEYPESVARASESASYCKCDKTCLCEGFGDEDSRYDDGEENLELPLAGFEQRIGDLVAGCKPCK